MKHGQLQMWRSPGVFFGILVVALCYADAASPPSCQRIVLEGQVNAGQEWHGAIGQGWIFRILPIPASSSGYSGWDLVVDRQPPAGYPDALLLATLPYDSINEREIGTTYGLRAQDAIGWNPRSFRFLTDPKDFREAQSIYQFLFQWPKDSTAQRRSTAMSRLLELEKRSSSGELRILDARIVPGLADPEPYAQAWALAGSRMQHDVEPVTPGQETARGKLIWMRFSLTLWLPAYWHFPADVHPVRVGCPG